MRPLGKHQLRLLACLSGITMTLVVPSKLSDSLVRRGLLEPRSKKGPKGKPPGFIGITPAGLRVVADLMEAGQMAEYTKLSPQRDSDDS